MGKARCCNAFIDCRLERNIEFYLIQRISSYFSRKKNFFMFNVVVVGIEEREKVTLTVISNAFTVYIVHVK